MKRLPCLPTSTLKEILRYDCETGLFHWLKSIAKCVHVGEVAGHTATNGYVYIRIMGKSYLAHRLAWLFVYGDMKKSQIDHINTVKNDNRIINLRECTASENRKNTKVVSSNKTGVKGVHFDNTTGKWRASCMSNGKYTHLGFFDIFQDAVNKRITFAKLNHADFYRER